MRVAALGDGELDADLDAVVHPHLTAVLVPKVIHEDQVVEVAEALAHFEGRRAMPRGQVRIWPLVETAAAVQRSDRIARASARVAFMGGGTSRQGDIARALGFRWSAEGLETLYLRSKVLVDVAPRESRTRSRAWSRASRAPKTSRRSRASRARSGTKGSW